MREKICGVQVRNEGQGVRDEGGKVCEDERELRDSREQC